ncbi:MAG: DUF4251 domain-containing protein [Rikenellaceae bacterium]
MKKIVVIFAIATIIGYVVIGRDPRAGSPSSEAREVREQRREQRQAAMEQQIDSIVRARSFRFLPQTMQLEPAGRMVMLSNPSFEVWIDGGASDIFIPYIKGIAPPYSHVILNSTIVSMDGYTTEQTTNGWSVTFSSSLYSGSEYTFTFDIYSKVGTATLVVDNPWFNEVSYSGVITKIY